MYNISVLDKVKKPGIIAVDSPDGRYQHELTNLWSPDTELAKSCVLDLAPPLYNPGSASKIYDRSGKRNHGTINGATWVRLSSGLWVNNLDGDDFIDPGNDTSILGATTGTFIIWAWSAAAKTATENIICLGDTDGNEFVGMSNKVGDILSFGVRIAGTTQWDLVTDAAIGSDAWLLLGGVQNGTEPILYVNGAAPAQTFITSTNKTKWAVHCTGLDNSRIGCANVNSVGNVTFVTGRLALVRIFRNRALTAGQMVDIYRQERPYFVG